MDMTITNSGRVWMASVLFGFYEMGSTPLESMLTGGGGSPMGNAGCWTTASGQLLDETGTALPRVCAVPQSNRGNLSLLQFFHNNSSDGYNHFVVGTGTTPVAESDYALESPITSGVSISLAANRGDKRGTYFVTVANTGENILTVSEIGFFVFVRTNEQPSTAYTSKNVLFARAVLDEPVTLVVGESKTFDVTISF